MVDFIRLVFEYGYRDIFLSNTLLNFYSTVNTSTGEIVGVGINGNLKTPCQEAYHKDMKFRVYETGRCIVEGSLHKYWNNGEHNFNDFHIVDLKKIIKDLSTTFNFELIDAQITILEIGINLEVPYAINDILNNMFFHRKKPFKWTHTPTEGNYRQCHHDQYRIKLYDKTLQYRNYFKVDKELLRYEINYQGVKLRKQFGISTLEELINTPFINFLDALINEFELIVFYDFTINHKSTRLLNYSNRNYWLKWIEKKKSSSYQKHLNLLKQYTLKNSEKVQSQLAQVVQTKFMELSGGGVSIQSIHESLISIPIEDDRVCLVTGLGISMQRSDSKLLSIQGIRFYKVFNYRSYLQLAKKYLTDHWEFSSDEKKIEEIAHNIRNTYYNRQRRFNHLQLTLPI